MEPLTLQIRLFGKLQIMHGATSLSPLGSVRAESLLTYLLLHHEAHQPRQLVAFLLWPDSSESQARTNLRHVLHTLRHALPDSDTLIEVTPRTLRWRADAPCWWDVSAFEEAVARSEGKSDEECLTALREAVDLYTGHLLEGCYDEWILAKREHLRQRYMGALERLATLLEARGDIVQAAPYGERLLRDDPLREESYRLLMRLYDARGDRARALRMYHVCTTTLDRELGIAPSASTREAYEALLVGEQEIPTEDHPSGWKRGRLLVGRAAEWSRLTACWRATEAAHPQIILVTGEPGVGKTRLVEEFRTWCAHRGAATAEARSYRAEGELAYGPLVEWLRSEPLGTRLRRLERTYLAELVRLLPELASETSGLSGPEPLPEREQRHRLYAAAARVFLTGGGPLLLVADDLHWWDPESLRFLHYLLRSESEAPMLVAATVRSEEFDRRHVLNDLLSGMHRLGRVTEIELDRLSREETAVLAERIAGRSLEGPDADQLYRETEGNPLFVVEAIRAGWTGRRAAGEWATPKIQAVIAARLGQLSEKARELVGIAATLGRGFTSDVLGRASGVDDEVLVRGLDELWRRGIFREQSADAYDFSHDKIRTVAYAALSPAMRRRNHIRLAQTLEQLYPDDFDSVAGLIASHYDRAGVADQAVRWYQRAAAAAQRLYANAEAIWLFDRALDLIRMLPAGPKRDAHELEILSALPGLLVTIEGYASSRLAAIQQRSREISRALGLEPGPPLIRSLAVASLSHGDFEAAHDAGKQLWAIAERDSDDVLLVEAAYVLGIAAFWQGAFEDALRHFETAVSCYRPDHRRAHLVLYGQDPKVVCLTRLGNTLWFLGQPEAAVRARDAALELADEIGHPYSGSVARIFSAVLALDMGDLNRLQDDVAVLKGERLEHEAKQSQFVKEVFDGYFDVVVHGKERGISRIQRVLDEGRQAAHAPGQQAVVARVLMEACAAAGDGRAGLAATERALEMGSARIWEAETRRFRAVFLAKLGHPQSEVEAEFGRALDVSQRQQAKMFVLKVAASLLRYRLAISDHSGARAARDLLAATAGTIRGGRGTRDLQEVEALLTTT